MSWRGVSCCDFVYGVCQLPVSGALCKVKDAVYSKSLTPFLMMPRLLPWLVTSRDFVITMEPHPVLFVAYDVLLLEHVDRGFHTTSILVNWVYVCTLFRISLPRVTSIPPVDLKTDIGVTFNHNIVTETSEADKIYARLCAFMTRTILGHSSWACRSGILAVPLTTSKYAIDLKLATQVYARII
jgi:hypothetical protein